MRILLAIDDSSCSEAAVNTLLAQFAPVGTDVRVIHVDEWPKGLPVSAAFAEGPEAARAICSAHDEARRRGRELVARAVQRLGGAGFRATSEVREGDARREILDCAADWQPDIIVLGSHGRRGLNRLLLGSVSDAVVRHADCSVLVVREPGGHDARSSAARDGTPKT
jgi:nucleotide-binding universal stress UspA family protein